MNSILDVPCLTQALHIHEGGRGWAFRKLSYLGGGGTKFFARKGDKSEKGGLM